MMTLFWEEACPACDVALEDLSYTKLPVKMVQVATVSGDPGFFLIGEETHQPVVGLRGVPAILIENDGERPLLIIGANCVRAAVAMQYERVRTT